MGGGLGGGGGGCFRGGGGAGGGCRGLGLGGLLPVARHDRRSLPWRQQLKRGDESQPEVQPRSVISNCGLRREAEHFRAAGPAPPAVDGAVVHDASQVALRVAVDLVPLPKQPLQCLLEQVLAGFAAGREQDRGPEQRVATSVDKRRQVVVTTIFWH